MSYLPIGGGRRDPRMARETSTTYGSYPPRSITPSLAIPIRERRNNGYNNMPYGALPTSRYGSSAPKPGDSGFLRDDDYPPGSRMRTGYDGYKEKENQAKAANKFYDTELNRRATPFDRRDPARRLYGPMQDRHLYTEDHAAMVEPAMRASEAAKRHGEARASFNDGNIGRLTKSHYKTHKQAAGHAFKAANNHAVAARRHAVFSQLVSFDALLSIVSQEILKTGFSHNQVTQGPKSSSRLGYPSKAKRLPSVEGQSNGTNKAVNTISPSRKKGH
ncbi:predicted protein [Uncinocarpus reesii 1704]|uniref:Uncharacterized protein n=1 Tax=Uncinocarpus reesii (strain UAMH 1704) TaxID=336963 RepID=C4JSA3_UNCRE|nr:uncharacterized protein UREG_05342 [Uncinocarpus reesii 1704]EEP80500.1 predicted protein [Uncinocarpus reesii 1704]